MRPWLKTEGRATVLQKKHQSFGVDTQMMSCTQKRKGRRARIWPAVGSENACVRQPKSQGQPYGWKAAKKTLDCGWRKETWVLSPPVWSGLALRPRMCQPQKSYFIDPRPKKAHRPPNSPLSALTFPFFLLCLCSACHSPLTLLFYSHERFVRTRNPSVFLRVDSR